MITAIARRAPAAPLTRLIVLRGYTTSAKEGSVAQSRGFGKKEKAHEDEYARKHEAELLRKLKAEIEAKKEELAKLQEKHDEVNSKH